MAKSTKNKKTKKSKAKKTKLGQALIKGLKEAVAIEKKKPKVAASAKKQEAQAQEKSLQPAPPIPEGLISISIDPADLVTLANLMSVCAQTFEGLALTAASQNNDTEYTLLSARQRMSTMFANKFVEFCKMPEPVSRDLH